MLQAAPALDPVKGAACVEAAPTCPGNEALFACLVPEYPGCGEVCSALEACGVPAGQCPGYCPLLYALEPAKMPAFERCVAEAGCEALGRCFELL